MAWNTRPTYQAAAPCSEPVELTTLPSGYSVTLDNVTLATALTPVPVERQPLLGTVTLGAFQLGPPGPDPRVGSFIRGGTIQSYNPVQRPYVADFRPDGHIGRPGGFTIGQSPIGYRHATHKAVTLSPTPGGPETEAP